MPTWLNRAMRIVTDFPRPVRTIPTAWIKLADGCRLAADMLQWAASMLGWNAWPPDPEIVGDRWRGMWLARMREAPPFIGHWLGHQRRDDYWKQGSVCEDFSRIEAAVYAVGGWADGYTNAIPRLLAGLPGPRKGLI